MKKITRLVYQKRDKGRVNVYLDDEFAFGLALVEAVHLKVGQMLSEDEIAVLQDKDAYQRAYQRSLDYLTRRPRSCGEIEQYLLKKNVSSANIERIVERLTELNLLDDLAFANYWIENRENFRPRGKYALRHELRQKGVSETIIEQALAQVEMDEVESAYRVALKKWPRLRAVESQWQLQQKLAGYLGRRGFDWNVIREVSARLWEARDEL
ncbi:MAG: regulatory protein RecX [Ardenticatenaceae bacterium]